MLDRRTFLRRTSLAIAGGLVVGDAALELFERLTHRTVFALGQMPNLLDLYLSTNYSAGMFSIIARPEPPYTGFGKVVIDGQPAEYVTPLLNGYVRVGRYLDAGKLEAKTPLIMAPGVVKLRAAQLEEGRFPSSFIETWDAPVTRRADRLSFDFSGHIAPTRSTLLRHSPRGPLVEGERTNYALHQKRLDLNGA